MLDLKKLLRYQLILIEGDSIFFATFNSRCQEMAPLCASRYPSAVVKDYGVEITECNPKDRTVTKWKKVEGKSVWIKVE